MNVIENRVTPVPEIQREYTCWIDASNWATATEAAGVCTPGQSSYPQFTDADVEEADEDMGNANMYSAHKSALYEVFVKGVDRERERLRAALIARLPPHERYEGQIATGNTIREILNLIGFK